MRCPDCGKFVAMENGEPDVSDVDVAYSDEACHVTVNARHTRNCADCSTELKDYDYNMEDSVELEKFLGWESLSVRERKQVLEMLKDGTLEATAKSDGGEVDESGGGR